MIMLSEALESSWPVRFAGRSREQGPDEPESLEERVARAPVRTLEAKKHVFTEGDQRSHLYRVETGAVCLYKVLPDGRRQVVGFAFPGDLLGFGPAGAHQFNAQTTRPSRLRCLSWRSIERVVRQNPALGVTLWEAISQELAAAHDLLLTNGQRTATERVAAFLLTISRRNARRGEDGSLIILPMTRTDIGDLLALTIETVSRVFSSLRRERIIDLAQSCEVRIRDMESLERLAKGGGDL
jgi:CRP/FNR family transcriptional regulator